MQAPAREQGVQVCDDFYEFTNCKWLESDNMPEELQVLDMFGYLQETSRDVQLKIVKDIEHKNVASLTTEEQKILAIARASKARFSAWRNGTTDYHELLDQLDQIKERLSNCKEDQSFSRGIGNVCADFHMLGIDSVLRLTCQPSLEDAERMLLQLDARGLSMLSRDHYLSESFEHQRELFRAHLCNIVAIVGNDALIDDFAERVFRFETKLAMISMTPAQSQQMDQLYSITTLDGVVEEANGLNSPREKADNYLQNEAHQLSRTLPNVFQDPSFTMSETERDFMGEVLSTVMHSLDIRSTMQANHAKYFPNENGDKEHVEQLICIDGDYFRRLFALLSSPMDREDIVAYFQYKAIAASRELTTKDLDEEFFNFYDRELLGKEKQCSEKKRTIDLINKWAGMLFGKRYVEECFPLSEKEAMLALIQEVIATIKTSLATVGWMTPATRAKAVSKLAQLGVKVGFPDEWEAFDELALDAEDSLLQQAIKVARFRAQKNFKSVINTPTKKTKWFMTPQNANAYYDPQRHEICFPAAILQPPFYYKALEDLEHVHFDLGEIPRDTPGLLDAVNCGSICTVIAHEIVHGFDVNGSKFDGNGNLVDWWEDIDRERFNERCIRMTKQILTWKVDTEHGTCVQMNPEFVMGECLADVTGISLALRVLLQRLERTSKKT